jgi:excisionase family DNA binding protein
MKGPGLSTGRAAQLCSVNPDTVLKWIKKGRLAAARTAGGHYRIDEDDLAALVPALNALETLPTQASEDARRPLRCWEYLGGPGAVRNGCKKCVVYQVRSAWCFQLASLTCDIGHSKSMCRVSCQDCVYYRRVSGLATNILVITSDDGFAGRLEQQREGGLELRFARSAYAASAMVCDFRPAFAVVDHELIASREPDLLAQLASDPRLPGLRIILAVPKGKGPRASTLAEKGIVGVFEKPFGQDRIVEVMNRFPVETMPIEERGARSGVSR